MIILVFCLTFLPIEFKSKSSFNKNKEGLTYKSIIYWAKTCNPKEFQKIHIECLVVNDASTIKQPILFKYIPKGDGETLKVADPEVG